MGSPILTAAQALPLPIYSKKTAAPLSMLDRMNRLADFSSTFDAESAEQQQRAQQLILTRTTPLYSVILDAMYTSRINSINSRLAPVPAAVASFAQSASTVVPQSISTVLSTATAQLAVESSARTAWTAAASQIFAPIDAYTSNSLSTAAADRSSIRQYRVNNTILASMSVQISAATSTTFSRGAWELGQQTVSYVPILSSLSLAVVAAINAEASRATAACNTTLNSYTAYQLRTTNGSTDGASWCVC